MNMRVLKEPFQHSHETVIKVNGLNIIVMTSNSCLGGFWLMDIFKAMKNIYLIKDLARKSGNSIYTIKFYLKLGLIKEIGRGPETNFRYFDDSIIRELEKIRALRKKGLSLSQIKEMADKRR